MNSELEDHYSWSPECDAEWDQMWAQHDRDHDGELSKEVRVRVRVRVRYDAMAIARLGMMRWPSQG